jgi:SNF2 family DNA or RNA helicase
MPATIVGELTADEQNIILIADGAPEDTAFAARQLQTLTPKIGTTKPSGALQLPATWPAVVQLSMTYGAAWKPGPRLTTWIAEQFRMRTEDLPTELSFTLPQGLVARPYQVEGAHLIARHGSGTLYDEPGTGKTITTILGLVERATQGHQVFPAVIVAPASVVDSWVSAFAAWAPQYRAIAWRGTPAQRRNLAGTADVYVVSYDTARRDAAGTSTAKGDNPLMALRPLSVVADEAHLIKTPSTERSRAVRRLAKVAGSFVGLTGTPITHHPANMWPALDALVPGAWPSRERWVNRYCVSIPSDYGEEILGLRPSHDQEFRTTLLGQQRRVAKADVLTQLPPKVYSVRTVEMPAAYRKAYDDMERDMLAELPDGEELSVMGVLAQMTRLAQLASAAADVRVETVTEWDQQMGVEVEKQHTHVSLKAPSWKVDALLELLDERPGRQTIATAPSKQLMVLAGEAAAEQGYRVGYVMGGQNARERTETIESFQAGDLDLICVTTGAGGVGITLTAADCLVFLQRPWSLVEAMQMEDRAHRIGSEQHSSIEIVDIVTAKTIDTRVRQVLRERGKQLADFVQDSRVVAELLGGASVTKINKRRAAA